MKRESEVWIPLTEFPAYAVSNFGRVKRILPGPGTRAGRMLAQIANRDGYLNVHPQSNGRRKGYGVHRLVCEAFNGPPPSDKHQAAHNDGVRTHNRPHNLRWATHAENMADREIHGTTNRGERSGSAKLAAAQVRAIRTDTRPQRVIAQEYGISPTTVRQIRKRQIWASLGDSE